MKSGGGITGYEPHELASPPRPLAGATELMIHTLPVETLGRASPHELASPPRPLAGEGVGG